MTSTESDVAVGAVRAAVDALLEVDWRAAMPSDLAAAVRELEVQRRRLDAVDVDLLAALAQQAVPADFGATSVTDLIGALTGASRGEARARVTRSTDLAERRTLQGERLEPIHPATAAALSAGQLSAAHADVIVRYLGRIPADIANEARGGVTVFQAAEAFLVEAARHEDPVTLRRSGELMLARLDPDGTEPRADEAERRRGFGIGGRAGANSVWGQLTDENKAVWQAVLDTLAAPQPAEDGVRDDRSPSQRAHDAMLEAGLRLLGSRTLPSNGGAPVSVVVHVDADDLAACARGEHGAVGRTAHGDVVSVERFLRLADQAEITTVVLSAGGQILDYGRDLRCASSGQRKALAARDGGCCFPGCTRPAAWCEAHHLRAWIRGGRTSLDNLCLLCPYHHRTFEAAGWVVALMDGVPCWTPPARLDATQTPRRNTAHHLADLAFAAPARAG